MFGAKAGRDGQGRRAYTAQGQVWAIPPRDILPNPDQPRRVFDEDKLAELTQSIRENGLLQPLSITFRQGKPVLVAGERRLRAALRLGLETVPCVAVEADRPRAAMLALIENLQREDMTCFEEAAGIRRLMEEYGLTQEETAARLGCTQPTIANKLRLLRLSAEEQQLVLEAGLTERHARALLRLPDAAARLPLWKRVIAEQRNVAQTERLVESALHAAPQPPDHRRLVPLIRDVRVFFNTVDRAVETMKLSGIAAEATRTEGDGYIEYTVRIPRTATRISG